MAAIDMTGTVYGKLHVLSRHGSTKTGQATWLAQCSCGNTTVVSGAFLRKGHTRSCGCLHKEAISTHGAYKSRTYRIWGAMKSRCAVNTYYANVDIHPPWAESYTTFLADMGECPEGHTLDRMDNNKGYEPSNCRWATMKEQVQNRRINKLDSAKAKAIRADARPATELAAVYGVHPVTIRAIRRGASWA